MTDFQDINNLNPTPTNLITGTDKVPFYNTSDSNAYAMTMDQLQSWVLAGGTIDPVFDDVTADTITTTGSVGIRSPVTSPYTLYVNSQGQVAARFRSNSTSVVFSSAIDIQTPSLATPSLLWLGGSGTTLNQLLRVSAWDGNFSSITLENNLPLRFEDGGNQAIMTIVPATMRVGIGSGGPVAKLQVEDQSNATILIAAGSSSNGVMQQFRMQNSSGKYNWFIGAQRVVDNGFEIGPSTVADGDTPASPVVRLTNTGNFGLGVTPTAASLPTFESEYALLTGRTECNIVSNAVFNSGFKYINAAEATRYQGNAGSHIWSRAVAGSNPGDAVTWLESALINPSGFFKASNSGTYLGASGTYHEIRSDDVSEVAVAIQSTNASYTGTVTLIRASKAAGTTFNLLNAQSNLVDQFTVRGDGTVYAQNTTIQAISDERLKENIVDSTEGLDVITALRPVRYDWKPGHGNDRTHQLGFIAQEIEAVFPDAVSEWVMGSETYKTVGPAALIPVLVKAIQELDTRLKALEA